jgi:hypothetical protein
VIRTSEKKRSRDTRSVGNFELHELRRDRLSQLHVVRALDLAHAAESDQAEPASGQTLSDYLLVDIGRLAALLTRGEMLATLHRRKRVTPKTR